MARLGPPSTSAFSPLVGAKRTSASNAKDTICEYPPYADEYTLFGCFDRLLQQCEDHGLQMTVVQGGADEADAMARDWVLHNKEISSQVELVTGPHYFVACRL